MRFRLSQHGPVTVTAAALIVLQRYNAMVESGGLQPAELIEPDDWGTATFIDEDGGRHRNVKVGLPVPMMSGPTREQCLDSPVRSGWRLL